MRILVQRVSEGSVWVDGQVVGSIKQGYVLLVGIAEGDEFAEADQLAEKIVRLRLFSNEADKFDRCLLDLNGQALVVSQFTLYGDPRKGRRPSFSAAACPQQAKPLCDYFAQKLRQLGVTKVATGQFGAKMTVHIRNEGPVTLWLDSDQL